MLGQFGIMGRSLLLAGVCALATPTAQAQDYSSVTLKHASGLPASYPPTSATSYFNDRLSEVSGGKVKVQMFWGGALGGLNEAYDQVSKGAVDISDVVPGYFITQLPLMSMPNALPHTFFEPVEAMNALIKLSAENPDLIAEYDAANVKPLIFRYLTNYHFYCTRPVDTVDGFRGLKIRSFGNYIPKMMEAIGAVPVNVVTSDVYEALKRGSLDCAYSPATDAASYKLQEVAKYFIDVPMGGIAAHVDMMNLKSFNALTPETQKLLVETGLEASKWWADQSEQKAAEALEVMKQAGIQVVEFKETDKLHGMVPDMVALWNEAMKERGLEAVAANYSEALMSTYKANAK